MDSGGPSGYFGGPWGNFRVILRVWGSPGVSDPSVPPPGRTQPWHQRDLEVRGGGNPGVTLSDP